MGQSPSSTSYNADSAGLPFYQGNADFGAVHPEAKTWCTDPKKVAEQGDVLISVRAPIGAINVADERCCIGRGIAALRPHEGLMSQEYLVHLLQSNRKALEAMGTGSTFKAIGKKALSNFEISLHDPSEQQTISAQLGQVLACIKLGERQFSLLDALVKSRFVEMFGSSRFESCMMDDLVADIVSGTNVSGQQRPLEDSEYGVLRISAVTRGVFDSSEYKAVTDVTGINMIHPHKGDLLFSRANTSEMVGATAIVDNDYDRLFLPDKLWRLDPANKVETVFLKALLSSPAIRAEMSKVSTGSSGSMQNISMAKFRKLPAFLPPLALQQEFADFVATVDKSRFVAKCNEKL